MDGCDFYDTYVGPLNELELNQLAKLADYALPSNWMMIQEGPEHTADLIADKIYENYMSGACDVWGPTAHFEWFLHNVFTGCAYMVPGSDDVFDSLVEC